MEPNIALDGAAMHIVECDSTEEHHGHKRYSWVLDAYLYCPGTYWWGD